MVAVNKIDKEGADPNRVRGELAQQGLTPADWGGDTEFVDVSAKTHAEPRGPARDARHARRDPGAAREPGRRGERVRDRVAARPGPRPGRHAPRPSRAPEGQRLPRRRRGLGPRARDARLPRQRARGGHPRRCRSRSSASTACPDAGEHLPRGRERPRGEARRERALDPHQAGGARAPGRPQRLARGRARARRARREGAEPRAQGRRGRLARGARRRDRRACRRTRCR